MKSRKQKASVSASKINRILWFKDKRKNEKEQKEKMSRDTNVIDRRMKKFWEDGLWSLCLAVLKMPFSSPTLPYSLASFCKDKRHTQIFSGFFLCVEIKKCSLPVVGRDGQIELAVRTNQQSDNWVEGEFRTEKVLWNLQKPWSRSGVLHRQWAGVRASPLDSKKWELHVAPRSFRTQGSLGSILKWWGS